MSIPRSLYILPHFHCIFYHTFIVTERVGGLTTGEWNAKASQLKPYMLYRHKTYLERDEFK